MQLSLEQYRSKLLGCWLGKNIGGTLGAPFECQRATWDITYYTQELGGQPLPNETAQRTQRARGLRTADKRQQLRLAQDNVLVQELYRGWLGEPNGHTAHQALHTSYGHRRRIAAEAAGRQAPQVEIKACVGTSCYLHGARDVLRRLSEELERRGIEATVELQGAFCLERCDRGPNVVINGREYNHVREQDVPELLQQALAEAVPHPQPPL